MEEVNKFDYNQLAIDDFSNEYSDDVTERPQDDFINSEFNEEMDIVENSYKFEETVVVCNSVNEEEHIFKDVQDIEESSEINDNVDVKKDVSFTGRYKCTCGCTNFIDIGGNMCKCGHLWWNHKFWKD